MLPGRAEYPLQGPAARDGVLSGQRVEQVEGIVVVERAGPPGSRQAMLPGCPATCRRACRCGNPATWSSRADDSLATRRPGRPGSGRYGSDHPGATFHGDREPQLWVAVRISFWRGTAVQIAGDLCTPYERLAWLASWRPATSVDGQPHSDHWARRARW